METHYLTSTPALYMHAHTHENMHTCKGTYAHHTHTHTHAHKKGGNGAEEHICSKYIHIKMFTQGATLSDFPPGYHEM